MWSEGNQSDIAERRWRRTLAAGEAIGDPIVAEDDDGDVLTYTLYDDGNGHSDLFAIDWGDRPVEDEG